jgi:alanyl-tRNA synthetase
MSPKEAVGLGALALFGEKYGDEVRVVFIGKENNVFFSTELCGGTHVKNTKEIGEFKIVSQSSIASGVRRVEALRDKQLKNFENSLNEKKMSKDKNLSDQIEITKNELKKLNIKPNYDENFLLEENLKNLVKQLDLAKVKDIILNKNKVIDDKLAGLVFRKQVLTNLPPKELRSIVDQGKKEIKSGVIMACCTYEGKVGVAIGVTDKLIDKFDAVKLVKEVSEILGGKGGGGRKDFAQAGGTNKDKIEEAFEALSKKLN